MVPLGTALFKLSYRPAMSGAARGISDAAAASELDRLQRHRRLAALDGSSALSVPSADSLSVEGTLMSSSPAVADLMLTGSQMAARTASVEATDDATVTIEGMSSEGTLDQHPFVLFLGQPAALLHMLALTDFYPRLTALPVSLPAVLQQLSFWVFSVSAAVALVNCLPVFCLDGAAALTAALDMRTIDLPAAIALPMEPRSLCSSSTMRTAVRRYVLWSWSGIFAFVLGTQLLRIWV